MRRWCGILVALLLAVAVVPMRNVNADTAVPLYNPTLEDRGTGSVVNAKPEIRHEKDIRSVTWQFEIPDEDGKKAASDTSIVCTATVEWRTDAAPNAKWRGKTWCNGGISTGKIYRHVEMHAEWSPAATWFYTDLTGRTSHDCNAYQTCYTPWYYTNVAYAPSKRIKVIMDFKVGDSSTKGTVESVWYFNDKGKYYPVVNWLGWEMWFPNPPFYPPQSREPGFREAVIAYWQSLGIPIPPYAFDAHHVQPVNWGGTNSPTNGFLVMRVRHQTEINPWWVNFTPGG